MCALDSWGAITCWGVNDGGEEDFGQVRDTPSDTDFVRVNAGFYSTCGIHADGTAECWGRNIAGEASPPIGTWKEVSVGYLFGCGINSADGVECWGLPGHDDHPAELARLKSRVDGTCGVSAAGALHCWGYISEDSIDYGQFSDAPTTGTWQSADLGRYHACGVRTSGSIECWGLDDVGQASPPEGDDWVEVQTGEQDSCALNTSGRVSCWGIELATLRQPDHVQLQQISTGYVHTCGLSVDHEILCWGADNPYSELFPGWIGFEPPGR